MLWLVDGLFLYLGLLLGVAYFTLFERKVLAAFHLRAGPNKVGFSGWCQPLADAIKLFTKEFFIPREASPVAFFWAPSAGMLVTYMLWQFMPLKRTLNFSSFDVVIFFAVARLNVYVLMIRGWARNSKYPVLAANRAVAQVISYEVVITLLVRCFIMLLKSYNLIRVLKFNGDLWVGVVFPLGTLYWFVLCLAETNRAPFDFVEAESELVSGYTTEYARRGFALLFISEYGNVVIISYFTVCLLFGCRWETGQEVGILIKTGLMCYWFI